MSGFDKKMDTLRRSPTSKQGFVVAGAAINMAQFGFVMGFTAILLPQLRREDSGITTDESSRSWIAAIPGFALIVGNFIIPPTMGKFGRKPAGLISITFVIAGWLLTIFSRSTTTFLIARVLQGLSMGMSSSLSPILIGEYTSPKNRGSFVTCVSVAITAATLTVHTIGSYLSWQKTAIICCIISFSNLLIVICSPESPSWLASQGRYDDCRKVFYWLRSEDEAIELERMIEANINEKQSQSEAPKPISKGVVSKLVFLRDTMKKKEFFKPIIIMMHVFTLYQWGGINLLAAYTVDMILNIVGNDINIPILIISLDIFRLFSGFCAIYIMKRMKRRTLLTLSVGLNVLILFVIAGYSYAKVQNKLPFDHPSIGIALILIHTFTVATGGVPLALVLSGELFPLAYRSLSGGISSLFCSINLFIIVKSVMYLFNSIGLHGAYCLYGGILLYSLVVTLFFLPETKDKTLQEIENEFKGYKERDELLRLQNIELLNSVKG